MRVASGPSTLAARAETVAPAYLFAHPRAVVRQSRALRSVQRGVDRAVKPNRRSQALGNSARIARASGAGSPVVVMGSATVTGCTRLR